MQHTTPITNISILYFRILSFKCIAEGGVEVQQVGALEYSGTGVFSRFACAKFNIGSVSYHLSVRAKIK